MTQANNRHGADWAGVTTLTAAEINALDRQGGTESNRARAARGGPMGADVLSVYLDGQRIAGAPMDRVEVAGVRCGCGAYPGQDHWSDCSALERPGDHESPTGPRCTCGLPPDGTGGHARGCPARPTSAAWSGAVPGPVVSLPSTLAEAERLYGKGSPVWEAVRACDLAGVAPPLAASAQPTPAPGQVWLPPVGASGHPPGWVDLDGTVTIADSPATAVDGLYRLTRGGTATAEVLQRGQCIGVATPHGRVMVGDAFCFEDGHQRDVLAVMSGTTIDLDGRRIDAADLVTQAERWRYAPARAGEQYRHRAEGRTVQIVPDRQWMLLREEDSSDLYALRAGGSLDPAQWERLDPGARDDGSFRLTPEQIDGVVAGYMSVIREHQRVVNQALAACSPLTATGEDLDRQARLYGIDRRPAQATAYCGGTDRETDESLRARCLERLGLPGGREPAFLHLAGIAIDGASVAQHRDRFTITGTVEAGVDHGRLCEALEHWDAVTLARRGQPDVSVRLVAWTMGQVTGGAERVPVEIEVEQCRETATTAYEHAAAELAKQDRVLSVGADVLALGDPATPTPNEPIKFKFTTKGAGEAGKAFQRIEAAAKAATPAPSTLTLQAPARDLRSLFDAIGRALESVGPHVVPFSNGTLALVLRDEMLFAPEVSTGSGASIHADAKHLRALRRVVADALADPTGRAHTAKWGKYHMVKAQRMGPALAASTRYQPNEGGADQWRWEVGE